MDLDTFNHPPGYFRPIIESIYEETYKMPKNELILAWVKISTWEIWFW